MAKDTIGLKLLQGCLVAFLLFCLGMLFWGPRPKNIIAAACSGQSCPAKVEPHPAQVGPEFIGVTPMNIPGDPLHRTMVGR